MTCFGTEGTINTWRPYVQWSNEFSLGQLWLVRGGYTASGDGIGGYNTDVDGWVQVSSSVYPGMRLADSIEGGDQYDLTLKVQLFAGNWWVRVGAEWMGYYPSGLYNASGLAFQADTVDWGGEIVDTLDRSLAPMRGYTSVTNPLSYDLAVDFSGTTSWGSNFFWGGPGGI